jgi:type II secretory pathway pseudopilin PulG
MTIKKQSQQKGITFIGLLVVAAMLALIGVVVAQVVPTLVELQSVSKAAKKAAADATTVGDVRAVFDRAAQIDDIKSIEGKDLTVTKVGEKIVVSFAYQREIHLAGPAWLTLKYEGSTR